MADLEPEGPGTGFNALTALLVAMGVELPYERLRKSHNVVEAIPGTTNTTWPAARRVYGVEPEHQMAKDAGIDDIWRVTNPWIFYHKKEREDGRGR